MSINAKYLVSLPPRTIRGGTLGLETNGMLLTKSALIPADTPAVTFGSYQAVSDFFGPESEEASFAQQYFTGLTNQQRAPMSLIIGRRIAEDAAAWIRSAEFSSTLADLKKISDGSLKITVDGTEKTATAVDLTSVTSLSDAAETIATAITGVTGAYDSNSKTFTFTSATTGAESTITYASAGESGTDLSATLGLTQAAGAVLSQGKDAMTEAANLDAVTATTANWVIFTTLWEITEAEEAKAYAAWADVDDEYIYAYWSSDVNMLDVLTQPSTVAAALNGLYDCTIMLYGNDPRIAAFVCAYCATIDWTRTQGMKVLFGKTASGLEPTITAQAQAEALDDLRVSYIGQFATRNAEFQIANRGALTSTQYGFLDVLLGMIWFRSNLQNSIVDGFTQVNRVPYTKAGYTIIRAWCQDPINQAKNCGVIDEGLFLDESQRAQIMQETGSADAAEDIQTNGFWIDVSDPTTEARAARETPVASLYYAYAGSVQRFEMPVTAVL